MYKINLFKNFEATIVPFEILCLDLLHKIVGLN